MTRLDEMDLNEITFKYKNIFKDLVSEDIFNNVLDKIEKIYDEYIFYVDKKYKVRKGTFGRGEIKWGRNIIWGWYIELLIKEVLLKNKKIKRVESVGGDSSYSFIFKEKEKEIAIDGRKTSEPDFLITLNNKKIFCIELKTSAVGIFSVKKSNVQQLYKETAYNNRITLIMMIDLVNGLYGLENLNYFNLIKPFVNQRMEGQLCYNFPAPEEKINNLTHQDFNEYLNDNIFELDFIRKLKALKKAEDINNRRFIKIIKSKISLEKKIEDMEIKVDEINKEIEKIKEKCPSVVISWKEIYKELGV